MTDFYNNPFPPGKSSSVDLTFKLGNVSLSNILRFDFNSTTLTNETQRNNNNVTLIAKILLKTDLDVRPSHEPEQMSMSRSPIVGLSSIRDLDQFGTNVTHVYTVSQRTHLLTVGGTYETTILL